jgi:hypothetical protein
MMNSQALIDSETRSDVLKKVMMLKSWVAENLTVSLTTTEYNYIAKALLDETGVPYSNRDLFDLQLWAERVPELPGKIDREKSDFDTHIESFMNKVGLNWDYWGQLIRR